MHVETPHHPPGSAIEFLRQYAMIVLSILTALALERVAVSISQSAAASASKVRIEAELARDAADLQETIKSNTENADTVRSVLKPLIGQLKLGSGDAAKIMELARPLAGRLELSMPSWQREAWDSAIADQSATHMAPAELQRYAKIYADEQDDNNGALLLLGGEWLTRAADLQVDFQLGQVDGRKLAGTLARFLMAADSILSDQKSLLALAQRGAGK